MGNISERCYSAGWESNLEYVLWDTLFSGPRKYGQDLITKDDIDSLKRYSEIANSWIIFHEHTEETALNLTDWKNRFELAVKNNPELLNG